jgi:exodeoxyribonuclease-1
MLYSGGFFGDADKRAMQTIRQTKAELLPQLKLKFADSRLDEMLFRYRARNYPQTLDASEKQVWEEFRYLRLTENSGEGYLTLEQYHEQIEQLQNDATLSDEKRNLLAEMVTYGDQLL